MRVCSLLLTFLILVPNLRGDDGAASIAAGGIVTMKREPRIVMAKEVLRIGPQKVTVDYDFRNDSDQDIKTPVAFPIAPYSWEHYFEAHEEAFNELSDKPSDSRIASFRLTVDGKRMVFHATAKALLNGHDYAPLLRSMKVDPATFGHLAEGEERSDFDALTAEQLGRLRQMGLISKDQYPTPAWTVELRYYWVQKFPAHQLVHIRHEYKPITGEQQSPPDFCLVRSRISRILTQTPLQLREKCCIRLASPIRLFETFGPRLLRDHTAMSTRTAKIMSPNISATCWLWTG